MNIVNFKPLEWKSGVLDDILYSNPIEITRMDLQYKIIHPSIYTLVDKIEVICLLDDDDFKLDYADTLEQAKKIAEEHYQLTMNSVYRDVLRYIDSLIGDTASLSAHDYIAIKSNLM